MAGGLQAATWLQVRTTRSLGCGFIKVTLSARRGDFYSVLRRGPSYTMEPSKQVNRRTNAGDLAKRLLSVEEEGFERHNQQVLWDACTTEGLVA